MKRVIAIDPGYERCGVAVLELQNRKPVLLFSDCITTSKNSVFAERLGLISKRIDEILETFSPDSLAIEKLHLKANRQSAMHVAETRGAIISKVSAHGLSLFEYSPATVKLAVAGYGKADKAQVMAMVKRQINVPEKKMLDDEFDAIAVGLCSLVSEN